jgi:triosephosphate isomerase
MRKPFIAGNWKMNTNSTGAVALAAGLAKELKAIESVDVAVCPPFVYLQSVAAALSASNIALGSQDVYFEGNGAFTGEISVDMLKDCCVNYAIIGHSERRHVIGESDELINKKVTAAIAGGLLPIFCVGELLEERESGKTTEVVANQVKKGLAGLCKERVQAVTIAYEPVWAIGNGQRPPVRHRRQEVHAMIRRLLTEMYGKVHRSGSADSVRRVGQAVEYRRADGSAGCGRSFGGRGQPEG